MVNRIPTSKRKRPGFTIYDSPFTASRGSSKPHGVPPGPVFSWRVRVYYEDTDSGGVVYYANYLKFLERARTEWLRALGFELDGLARDHGAIFIVRSLSIEYLRPAAFNDEIAATVELGELGGGQIILMQRITRGAEELATARVRLACVNTSTLRPVRIPGPVAARIGKRT